MPRALRGKKPETVTPGKPKIIVFGPPGVGKTHWACDFPKVYYIDIEAGGTRKQYRDKLIAGGGFYMGKDEGSQDFRTVIEETETLATTRHDFLTVVYDSFTWLYLMAAALAESHVGSDFGKDKKEANKPTRQLLLWLERLDMNVVLICHSKDKWKKMGKELVNEGTTFDAWEKMDYLLDLCVEVAHEPRRGRMGIVRKTRFEEFPLGSTFPWTFADFSKRIGEETILRPPSLFQAADPAVIAEINKLVSVLKLDSDWVDSVLSKAGITEMAELPADKAAKTLDYLKAKIAV
jgi:hypothetical protein